MQVAVEIGRPIFAGRWGASSTAIRPRSRQAPSSRCLPAYGGQLRPIAADIGHVMGDDQMVLGVDGDLRIVADNASALTAGRIEWASGSVRETCLSDVASAAIDARFSYRATHALTLPQPIPR